MARFGRLGPSSTATANPSSQQSQDERRLQKNHDLGIGGGQAPSTPERIALVEQASGATLPSRLVLGLAQANTDQQELRRASKLVARILDVSPQYLFQPSPTTMGSYIDPVTGGTISLETARRMIKPYEPKIIRSVLGDQLQQTARMGPNGQRVELPAISPTRIAKAFIALAPVEGHSTDFGTAMAMAMQAARSKIDLELFAHNVRIATTARGLSPGQQVSAAQVAASQGLRLQNFADMAKIILGPQAVAAGQARAANVAAVAKAGGYISLEEQKAAEMNAAVQAAAQGNAAPQPAPPHGLEVAGFAPGLSAGLLDLLKNGEGDYNAEGQKLISQMKASQNVFGDSWVAKNVFHPIGYAINKLSGVADVTSFIAGQIVKQEPLVPLAAKIPGAGHPLAEVISLGLYNPKDPEVSAIKDPMQFVHDQYQVARDLFYQRNTFGDWFASEAGLPHWTGGFIELASQFYASPDAIALRAVAGYRAARLISSGESYVTFANRFIFGAARPLSVLPQSRRPFAESLARIFRDSSDPEQAFVRQVDLARTIYEADGLDSRTVAAMWQYANAAKTAGHSEADLTKGIQYLMARSMGLAGKVDETKLGELARWVEQSHLDTQRLADTQIPLDLAKPAGYRPAAKVAASESDRSLGLLDSWDQYLSGHGPIQLEVPHAVGVPRRLLSAARNSELVGGSKTYRAVSALFNETPAVSGGRLLINVEENPVSDLQSIMRRSRVFSQEDLARARLDMSTAATPFKPAQATVGRELSIQNVVSKWNDEMLSRIESLHRLTPEQGEQIRNVTGGMFQAKPVNIFGATTEETTTGRVLEGVPIRKPLLPSQLPNAYEFIDPVWYRRGIAESMGTLRRMRNGTLRALHFPGGIPAAQLAHTVHGVPVTLPKLWHDSFDLVVKDLFLRLWKPLVVLRPAYITRVVGIEEQSRFLSTMGLMSRIESSRSGARVLGLGDKIFGDGRYIEYPFTRLDAEGNKISDLFRWERRPGRLPKDMLAANTNAKIISPGSDQLSRKILEAVNSKRWETVANDGSTHYYESWLHDLVNQAAKDPIGSRYLMGMRDGKPDEQIVQDTFDWLHTPAGRPEANALMGPNWTDDALHDQVETGVKVFRGYTPHADLAQGALDGTLSVDHLKMIPKGEQPAFVHGPELDGVFSRRGPFRKIVDTVHHAILQAPTNALSRHPYFKAWHQRMLKGILDEAQSQGVPLTEDFIRNAAKESRRFALGQVSQIMFDFTRQARLGEMADWLIPFFQPYSEAFTVWSRILARNPAVASYVTRLYNVGKETGFIKKDPTTGQDTISMDWWAKALSLVTLGHVALPDGFHASAPLNSINFFFQAGLPIPTGGIAGDVPFPLPGFNPEATFILQKVIDSGHVGPYDIPDGARARMASYLFQYGPTTPLSILPTWLRHAAERYVPSIAPDEINSTADEFLRLYQKLGFQPSTTTPVPNMERTKFFNMTPEDRIKAWKTYLSSIATTQAQNMEGFRAVASAFMPASPRIRSPLSQDEQDLAELRTKYGYSKGTDYFLSETATGIPYVDNRRHPELSLVTIGKSIWTGGENGTNVPGAGSPVSLPANPWVDRFLKAPGVKKFAQKYPEWVWAIIPKELQDAKFDTGSYFNQIAEGLRNVRSPMDFQSAAEQQNGWDGYFAIRTAWNNWQDTNPTLTEGTSAYQAAQENIYNAPIEQLKRENPDWAAEFGSFNTQGVDANVMAHARSLVNQPAFLKTDVGQGLKDYLDLRDELLARMKMNNITSIRTQSAETEGITSQYNVGVDQIIKEYPEFKTAYDFFFGNDLQGVPTYRERILPKAPPEVQRQVAEWETQYKSAQANIDVATDPIARSEAFMALRTLSDEAFANFSPTYNPLLLQWKSKTPEEQQQARLALLSKPYVFLTRFDREVVLQEKTNPAAEKVWEQYDASLTEIQKYQIANPGAPVGPLYDQINAQFATLAQNNPVLQTQLLHANDWTYLVRHVVPAASDKTDSGNPYWTSFLDAAHTVEVAATKADLHGAGGTGPDAAAYGSMRNALVSYRDQLFDQSPIFHNEYLQAVKALEGQDLLFDVIVPETWYPLGGAQYVSTEPT
jgi:hypothetical protein